MTVAAAKRDMQVIASAYERLVDHAERTAGRRAGAEGLLNIGEAPSQRSAPTALK